MIESLPVDGYLDDIVAAVRRQRAVVVTAAPGAGKTTRVPPALVADGRVIVLQPRRVAARAIARRIAHERGWTVGREVGWQVRFERQFSSATQLLVATEGVLTARLQQTPLLDDVETLVIDEFHERSLHADLAIALARKAWQARPDFRLVVMSATLDAGRVAAFLGDCPIVEVPGRTFPLDVRYRPGTAVEDAVVDLLPEVREGAVLVFLPGAAEIRRTAERLAQRLATRTIAILPLHGGVDADAQDAALNPSGRPRIILATNLAETTVTVPDVAAVVDTGLHKVARYDPERAIDSLQVERVSADSADQRAGRAGRVRAGIAVRLWDARDRLRPHREPEIARVDLAPVILDLAACGASPTTFTWFEAPPAAAIDGAIDLLRRLGAMGEDGALTEDGRRLARLPVHPRLGRLLIGTSGAPEAALACALLSERNVMPPRHGTTACDLLAAVDHEQALPPHVQRVARELRETYRRTAGSAATRATDLEFRRAVLAAYPDRLARRRASKADRFVLASGTGAKLSRDSGVHDAEFVVAVDVVAGTAPGAEAVIRVATAVNREWFSSTASETRHEIVEGTVRAWRIERYDALALSEHSVPVDPARAEELLATALLERGPDEEMQQLVNRCRFAGAEISFEALVRRAVVGARALADIKVSEQVPADVKKRLDRDAPAFLSLDGGRRANLDYRADGRAVAAVKLQHLFGMTQTPKLGPRHTPVTFELLAPNDRPVQVTDDLASFWATGYAQVRRELRARYPKHAWPERPAPPASASKRKR